MRSPVEDRLAPQQAVVRHVAIAALWLQGLYVLFACAVGYYARDDYPIRAMGAGYGWFDPEYLLQPWGGHLMPGAFALAQPFAKLSDFAYAPIAVSLAVGQSVLAYLLYRTMVRHFGYRWRVLCLLGLYLVSIPVLQATVWWASAINALPLLACLVLMADRVLRWSVDHRAEHLYWILGLQLAALAFFEKAVLAPIFAALLMWALSPATNAWAAARDVARRAWVLWAGLAAVLPLWLVVYLGNSTSELASRPDAGVLTEQASAGLLGTFVPSLLGGPWAAWGPADLDGYGMITMPPWVTVLSAALVLGVALWLVTWGPRARRALLVPLVYGVAMLVLINAGRQGFLVVTAGLPRYYADLVVVTVIALAVTTTRLVHDPAPDQLQEWRPTRARPVVVTGAVLLAQVLLVGNVVTSQSIIRGISASPERPFVTRSLESLRAEGVGAVVLNGLVPTEVAGPLAAPYNEYRWFYAGVRAAPAFPEVTDGLLILGEDGLVVPGKVVGPGTPEDPDSCGAGIRDAGAIPLEAPVVAWGHVVRLDYLATEDTRGTLALGGGDPVPVQLLEGAHRLYANVGGGGDEVEVDLVDPNVAACATASVGVAVPLDFEPGP